MKSAAKMRKLDALAMALAVWGVSAAVILACGPGAPPVGDGTTGIVTGSTTGGATTGGVTRATAADTTGPKLDIENPTGETLHCVVDGSCDLLDILFVIDNSGTMGEEQLNVARNFPLLVEEIEKSHGSRRQPGQPQRQHHGDHDRRRAPIVYTVPEARLRAPPGRPRVPRL
jgi:hypothetical protein